MVDSVVAAERSTRTMPVILPEHFKSIFDVLGEVQHLGSTIFAGAEASLLWYKDTSKEPVCPRVELILKIIIILLIIFLGFIKSKPC